MIDISKSLKEALLVEMILRGQVCMISDTRLMEEHDIRIERLQKAIASLEDEE